ncbi:ScbA/BarX family gamma-butyrolactone biosynthesis protein [Streptomyces syringium]|uniref:ScbA/BarX family gamma-butyrolactone biosynthesis protein n=1 Tax=Streptomyces syringium TaxID=76729 RepID=UPI0037D19DDB
MSQTSVPAPITPSEPRLTTTVPREFVHRAAVAEVLLTGWRRLDELRFQVSAQWPRGHSFFTPVHDTRHGARHDPMLIAETVRQIGSLLAHAEFDVPLGHQFLMWSLDYTARPEQLGVGFAPAELELDVSCSQVRRRGGAFAGMRYDVVLRRDGLLAATGGAGFTCTSPEVYRRLRGPRLPGPPTTLGSPVFPQHVGRASAFDVVLSAADAGGCGSCGRPVEPLRAGPRRSGRWQLRADIRHPILFDHPVDHIPGMVLLEAARQAAMALDPGSAVSPTALTSAFHRYAELSSPCWIAAERGEPDAAGSTVTHVSGHQDDELLFTCAITTAAAAQTAIPREDARAEEPIPQTVSLS